MIRIVHNGKVTEASGGKDAARIVQVALDADWYKANVEQASPATVDHNQKEQAA